MSFIHPQCMECTKSELDLFTIPPTQTSIIGGQWTEVQPLSSLTGNGPIEFAVSGAGDDYFDFSKSWLRVTVKVVKGDGSNCEPDVKVAPVNNLLHSLFSQIDLSLNDTVVTVSNNTYPYRAYLDNLLSYGDDAKKTQLRAEGYYQDTAGNFEIVPGTLCGAQNRGMGKRYALFGSSQEVELIGHLHLDIFHQPKLVLNGVDMKLRLNRSKPDFHLQHPVDEVFKTVITSASFFVRRMKINAKVQMAHIKALEEATAKYPIRRVEMKTFSVPRGNLEAKSPNLFLGQRPKRLVIGVVENAAMNGSASKNPFNFRHFDMNFVAAYVDGNQVPNKAYTPDFSEKGKCMRSYQSLFHGMGKLGDDTGSSITREEYVNDGFALHVIDLTPDLSDGYHLELVEKGTVGVEIGFKRALTCTVNVVVYAEFENIIQIDRNRRVTVDY